MTKIIFLDIDGPMIPYRCVYLPGQTPVMTLFDPVAVAMLNNLCENYGWKIVIHSSWIRPVIKGEQATYDHCLSQGLKVEHFHEDKTCNGDIAWRYTRISEWLKRHPEIDNYVILDDEPYEADRNLPHMTGISDHLILIDYYDGLLIKHRDQIMNTGSGL